MYFEGRVKMICCDELEEREVTGNFENFVLSNWEIGVFFY